MYGVHTAIKSTDTRSTHAANAWIVALVCCSLDSIIKNNRNTIIFHTHSLASEVKWSHTTLHRPKLNVRYCLLTTAKKRTQETCKNQLRIEYIERVREMCEWETKEYKKNVMARQDAHGPNKYKWTHIRNVNALRFIFEFDSFVMVCVRFLHSVFLNSQHKYAHCFFDLVYMNLLDIDFNSYRRNLSATALWVLILLLFFCEENFMFPFWFHA